MLTERTPEAHRAVVERFRGLRSAGQFTPPSLQGTIVFPGFDGGAEWGGSAWDPETGLLYVNSNEMAWVLRFVPRTAAKGRDTALSLYQRNCSGCHRADRTGTPPEFPALDRIGQTRTREQISDIIRKGAGRMPGFGHLGDDAVKAVTRLLTSGDDVAVSEDEHNPTAITPALIWHRWI